MTLHAVDLATALEGDPPGPERLARTSEAYRTFIGPLGGTSAATALRAVLEHPGRDASPGLQTRTYFIAASAIRRSHSRAAAASCSPWRCRSPTFAPEAGA